MRQSILQGYSRRLLPLIPVFLWLGYIFIAEPLGYALFLLATVALHESGHIFAFSVLGLPLPHFRGRRLGLLLTPKNTLLSYPQEVFVCAAGPLFNLLAAAALIPALRTGRANDAHFCFFCFNLLTAALNLLPIRGFDGGRILAALLSSLFGATVAEKISGAVSLVFVLLFYFAGLFLFFVAGVGLQTFFFALLLLAAEWRVRPTLFADL